MPIPSIQAKVYCNLGKVISGQFADDYVQDSGLMKTRGSVDLDGIFTIEVGKRVEFAFKKDGNLSRIPRTLRVLSSYADPFTKVTKVSLGCLLTYLSDFRKPPQEDAAEGEAPEAGFKIRAFDDPLGGAAIPEEYRRVVGGYITAGYMLETLLDEVGINAGTIPLQNKYTKTEEEVSGPFLDKVADLLKSECLYGYLDENEVLQSININSPGNSGGPVIEGDDILNVDRIGSGELPGQAVYVSYQTRRMKSPDPATLQADSLTEGISTTGEINWEQSSSEGLPIKIEVNRKNGATVETYIYTGIVSSEEVTSYRKIAGKEVPILRRQTSYTFAAEAAQNVAQAYWELGISFANSLVRSITETVYTYDRSGNEVETRTRKYEPVIAVLGRSNLPIAFSATDYVSASTNEIQTSLEVQRQYNADGCQKTCNERWEHAVYHLQGQIGAYQRAKNAATADEVADRLNTLLATGLMLVDYNTQAQYVGRASRQERPQQVERVAGYYSQKEGTGPIPGRTETTLVYGNAESQRVIELRLPMSPDDTIEGAGESWSAMPSVAAQRAQTYGKVQNRMRLGHREGLSIQIAPEMMPAKPFAPIYVKASGLTGQYRVNGSSWTFDANGIVCSIDAMFWGGAGQE
jgi:hypothetical protein